MLLIFTAGPLVVKFSRMSATFRSPGLTPEGASSAAFVTVTCPVANVLLAEVNGVSESFVGTEPEEIAVTAAFVVSCRLSVFPLIPFAFVFSTASTVLLPFWASGMFKPVNATVLFVNVRVSIRLSLTSSWPSVLLS